MARPVKQGLDYFPLDVNLDDKMELLEAECGLTGFAIIIKLFQKIYREGYFIKWDEDDQLLFARKINSEITIVDSVINTAIKRGIFNKELFEKYKILTSKGIQKRYFEICRQLKRKSVEIDKNYLLINKKNNNVTPVDNTDNSDKKENSEETEINSEETIVNSEETEINSEFSTQKKRKEKKGKEIKSNQIYLENSEETQIDFTKDEKIRFDEILKQAQVELYNEEIRNEIITALEELYIDPTTSNKIEKIRLEHIDFAMHNFSKANSENNIKFPKAYFKKCLLSALDEAGLSNQYNTT